MFDTILQVYVAARKKMLAVKSKLTSEMPSSVSNVYYSALLTYALAVDGSSTAEVVTRTQDLMESATTYMDGKDTVMPLFELSTFGIFNRILMNNYISVFF